MEGKRDKSTVKEKTTLASFLWSYWEVCSDVVHQWWVFSNTKALLLIFTSIIGSVWPDHTLTKTVTSLLQEQGSRRVYSECRGGPPWCLCEDLASLQIISLQSLWRQGRPRLEMPPAGAPMVHNSCHSHAVRWKAAQGKESHLRALNLRWQWELVQPQLPSLCPRALPGSIFPCGGPTLYGMIHYSCLVLIQHLYRFSSRALTPRHDRHPNTLSLHHTFLSFQSVIAPKEALR